MAVFGLARSAGGGLGGGFRLGQSIGGFGRALFRFLQLALQALGALFDFVGLVLGGGAGVLRFFQQPGQFVYAPAGVLAAPAPLLAVALDRLQAGFAALRLAPQGIVSGAGLCGGVAQRIRFLARGLDRRFVNIVAGGFGQRRLRGFPRYTLVRECECGQTTARTTRRTLTD